MKKLLLFFIIPIIVLSISANAQVNKKDSTLYLYVAYHWRLEDRASLGNFADSISSKNYNEAFLEKEVLAKDSAIPPKAEIIILQALKFKTWDDVFKYLNKKK